jgi:cell division protein FtsL
VAAVLVAFVVVAAAVIWRRGYGLSRSIELQDLDRRRAQLEAQKASLERQLRTLTGRGGVGTIAEQQLNMRIPADSQVIVLPSPSVPGPGQDGHAAP